MSWLRRVLGGLGGREGKAPDFLAEALDLEARGDYANALTSYRLALREHPDDLRVLQNIAIAYSKTGQADEAVRAYRRALSLDDTLAGAHYGLAFLLLKKGDDAGAAQHLEAFLALPAGDAGAPESTRFRTHAQRTLQELRQQAWRQPEWQDLPAPDTDGEG